MPFVLAKEAKRVFFNQFGTINRFSVYMIMIDPLMIDEGFVSAIEQSLAIKWRHKF